MNKEKKISKTQKQKEKVNAEQWWAWFYFQRKKVLSRWTWGSWESSSGSLESCVPADEMLCLSFHVGKVRTVSLAQPSGENARVDWVSPKHWISCAEGIRGHPGWRTSQQVLLGSLKYMVPRKRLQGDERFSGDDARMQDAPREVVKEWKSGAPRQNYWIFLQKWDLCICHFNKFIQRLLMQTIQTGERRARVPYTNRGRHSLRRQRQRQWLELRSAQPGNASLTLWQSGPLKTTRDAP